MAVASFVVAVLALLWGIGWAIRQAVSDAERDRRIENIETDKATALGGIGRAIEAGIDPAAAHSRGAVISIELRWSTPTPDVSQSLYLVIRNLGPGGARIQRIVALHRPDGERLLDPPDEPFVLLPGEEESLQLALLLATRFPLTFLIEWIDGSTTTGRRQRERSFAQLPPR